MCDVPEGLWRLILILNWIRLQDSSTLVRSIEDLCSAPWGRTVQVSVLDQLEAQQRVVEQHFRAVLHCVRPRWGLHPQCQFYRFASFPVDEQQIQVGC